MLSMLTMCKCAGSHRQCSSLIFRVGKAQCGLVVLFVCFVSCPIASPELDLTEVRAQAGLWGRCCMMLVIISWPLPCILYSLIEGKGNTTCRSATSMQRDTDWLSQPRIGLSTTGCAQTECCWQQFKCIDAVFIDCILDDGNEQMGCLVAVHTCQGTEGSQEEGQGQETGCDT